MRGPSLRTLMAYPFVIVVLNKENNVIDYDVCMHKERIDPITEWFKNEYPYMKIRVYEFLLHTEIDGTKKQAR